MASIISVNGITYNGNNITMKGDKIIIDDVDVTPDSKTVSILVHGDIDTLIAPGAKEIVVAGSCKNISATSGDIEVGGNVGSVQATSGDIKVDGNINGSVTTSSGDIECKQILGNATTMSGDIDKRL